MERLVVIAGPERTGKMPLARKLLAEDLDLMLVHRDYVRTSIVNKMDEWNITLLMERTARALLEFGFSVVVCAWNMEPEDWRLWNDLSREKKVKLEWLDVREPDVAAMIPPLMGVA